MEAFADAKFKRNYASEYATPVSISAAAAPWTQGFGSRAAVHFFAEGAAHDARALPPRSVPMLEFSLRATREPVNAPLQRRAAQRTVRCNRVLAVR